MTGPHGLRDGLGGAALRGNLGGQSHEAGVPLGLFVAAAVLVVHQLHQLPQVPLLVFMAILNRMDSQLSQSPWA